MVLRKLGKGARAVAGRLVRAPRKGSVVVIEFPDGMHEYVTTPVKRVLRIAGREVFYIETINSRYRLEVRGRETPPPRARAVSPRLAVETGEWPSQTKNRREERGAVDERPETRQGARVFRTAGVSERTTRSLTVAVRSETKVRTVHG